jgi:hypothetical protein
VILYVCVIYKKEKKRKKKERENAPDSVYMPKEEEVDGQADKTDLPRCVQDAERELRVLFERAGQWRSGGGAEPRCVERTEKKARRVGVVQGVDHVSFAARYAR